MPLTHVETPDVHFLDPYIISVEDKTRIIVYSSVDPDRYFIYDLELRKCLESDLTSRF